MSLGGVRDEAEIRGHRRTYIGSMPGQVLQSIKKSGSKNPVFLLDEIDKMTTDFRGDPASALLEVLDPEQNNTFTDHYLEIPFDLSKVMFITTANSIYNIPRPLLDRMEVIELSSYTEEDKMPIAMNYLIPKQIKEHGLKKKNISFSENAVRKIIREYTREAGVRNLERQIASICRKVAREVVKNKDLSVKIDEESIKKYLGREKFRYGRAENDNQVGVTTGLAWTETGGDILSIEVALIKGKGKLTLTGKLGDVMKESAQAGLTYVRSKAEELGISQDVLENYDIHIHVPEGAIPKDGPSAGITMATTLASAMSGRKVRSDVAMTGEITLRGRVLPIGGLKEKSLAAHRAGIYTIIIPSENEKDLEDVPAQIRDKMKFVLVSHMDEVLAEALVPKEKGKQR
jgi:ATP-dependent Lon protease